MDAQTDTIDQADPKASEAKASTQDAPTDASADATSKARQPENDEEAAELALRVEAALLTSDRSMTPANLGEALGGYAASAIKQAVDTLNTVYDDTGRSFRIEAVAGGFQVMTRPAFADVLTHVKKTRSQSKLSPAALETLAVVAYKQPILRADLEAIRGVACGEVLKSLMERQLVKIVGRAEEIGRPMLYGTTQKFLETFGLNSTKDLPNAKDLKTTA